MGGSRRETPIEIYLRDFRRCRQSRKSIIMKAYPDTYLFVIAYYLYLSTYVKLEDSEWLIKYATRNR